MFLRHHGPLGGRDLRVDADDPDATVADLAAALDPSSPPGPLVVDGREVTASTPLDRAGVGHGSTVWSVSVAPPTPSTSSTGERTAVVTTPVVDVAVVGGLDAGRTFHLPPGTYDLGRGDGADRFGERSAEGDEPGDRRLDVHRLEVADPTVSRQQARLIVDPSGTIAVLDRASTNGTWIDGEAVVGAQRWPPGAHLRCGAAILRQVAPAPTGPHRPGGPPPWPWHRRHVPEVIADDRPPIEPPEDPEPPPIVSPVGIVAVAGSIAVGAAMVVLLGSWLYAAFALLGPVMLIAGALDTRIRRRRSVRSGGRRRQVALDGLDRALVTRRADHVARLDGWFPGPVEAVTIAAPAAPAEPLGPGTPGPGLWSVRTGALDAHRVRLGTGATSWDPPVAGDPRRWADDVAAVVRRHRSVPSGPVIASLRSGPLAIVGPVEARRALCRSIVVQATTAHGPADLRVGAILDRAGADEWSWLAWLPHADDPVAGSLLAVGADDGWRVASATTGPMLLLVVDDEAGWSSGRSSARAAVRAARHHQREAALGDADGSAEGDEGDERVGVAPIVLVGSRALAPPDATIVEVGADGSLTGPPTLVTGPAVACGTAADVAASVARSLARFVDPERDDPGRGLPDTVRLAALLGTEALTPAGIAARWRVAGADPAPTAVIGRTADGALELDLAADGPHALVAGTTGAGKSELLRTLVTSLAVRSSPRHLNVLLVDFKGGSAFDACALLPHTVGVVTDLDEHLAARALRCLEAELRHRERRLREAGATDLASHRAIEPADAEPLPRLVVVIDEFATLAAELPEFVDSLVGIAQRGRSLGVHLVLATQRPAGAVSDNIRANTALRIALRVHDAADSIDVVGTTAAADLPRTRPGRAVVRLGPRDLVTAQTAWTGGRADDRAPVRVGPLRLGPDHHATGGVGAEVSDEGDALARIVDAVAAAWALENGRPPRCPWPDPLPSTFDLSATDLSATDLTAPDDSLLLGVADDPDHQRQVPHRWRPADGSLLVVGRPGSGTSTALATVVLAAADRWEPAALHVHVIDLGPGDLGPLAGLPHVGAVVGADERERQRRLVEDLTAELARRRRDPRTPHRRHLLVVDGAAALHDRWDDLEPTGTWARLIDLVANGAEVGIHVVLSADGTTRLPTTLLSACRCRLALRLTDAAEAVALSIAPSSIPDLPPGRAIDPEGATLVQLGRYSDDLGSAVAVVAARQDPAPDGERPRPVRVLPELVRRSELPAARDDRPGNGSLRLVVGISDVALVPASLVLGPGGHALVAGPPRSGRTTALGSLAAAAVDAGAAVVAVHPDGDDTWVPAGVRVLLPDDLDLATVVGGTQDDGDPQLLVVVDDADRIAPDHPVLTAVALDRRPRRHLVAAARADRARTAYAHWLRELRADGCGLLLRPDPDLDGELTGARLPRHPTVAPAVGRGWLVGEPEGFVQVAITDPDARPER